MKFVHAFKRANKHISKGKGLKDKLLIMLTLGLNFIFIIKYLNLKPILSKILNFLKTRITVENIQYRIIDINSVQSIIDEPWMSVYFTPRKGDIVLDVGAYIGKYTLKAARAVGEEGLVITIEPDPDNYRILLENIKANFRKAKNIIALNIAAWKEDGEIELYRKASSIGTTTKRKGHKIGKVHSRKLDGILKELHLKKIDYLKIDVEGSELEVIEGARETLEQNSVKIVVEVDKKNEGDIKNLLKEVEYEYLIVNKGLQYNYAYCYKREN